MSGHTDEQIIKAVHQFEADGLPIGMAIAMAASSLKEDIKRVRDVVLAHDIGWG